MFSLVAAGAAIYGYVVNQSTAWQWLLPVSLLFLGVGLWLPAVLRPVHAGWMKFAELLGWMMTRVLLAVFFYLVITPTGLIMRAFGRDPMERKFDRTAASYWKRRERQQDDRSRLERQF